MDKFALSLGGFSPPRKWLLYSKRLDIFCLSVVSKNLNIYFTFSMKLTFEIFDEITNPNLYTPFSTYLELLSSPFMTFTRLVVCLVTPFVLINRMYP